MIYEMTRLSGDHEYEVIDIGGNTPVTQGAVLEEICEIPASVKQHPPPSPPIPVAIPTGVVNEGKNSAGDAYYNLTVISSPPHLPEATPTVRNMGVNDEGKNSAGDAYYNLTVISSPPHLPEATPTMRNMGVNDEGKNSAGDAYYNITIPAK